jgi:hypothetical protein
MYVSLAYTHSDNYALSSPRDSSTSIATSNDLLAEQGVLHLELKSWHMQPLNVRLGASSSCHFNELGAAYLWRYVVMLAPNTLHAFSQTAPTTS